jgi:hypothetical protein
MDELRRLIAQYDPYYEMSDDSAAYHRGSQINSRIRALAAQLRVQGHGTEIDALAAQYPDLVSCPGGVNALA